MLVWLSLDTWLISILSIGYLAILFFVAYWGQKFYPTLASKPWVYSLCLGVSCSSWAFYGTVSQAAATGQWLAPIYIGTIACFVLAWPILQKLLAVSKANNLTSIADFVACRFSHAPKIAGVITLIALLGTLPYITLQLRAISHSFDLVTGTYQSGHGTTIVVTIVLIIFCILFGTRHVQANKPSPGLAIAIAFSSLIKLMAIVVVGLFVTYGLFDGFSDVIANRPAPDASSPLTSWYSIISTFVIGFVVIFVTPQLYHMIVIENDNERQLKQARWGYPLYLILINLFILPIAIAGQSTFIGGSINADTFMLTLPLFFDQAFISTLVFIGGLAAATSMVIVAAIVLSTMITTEIVNPLMLKLKLINTSGQTAVSSRLLYVRRVSIASILLLSLLFDFTFSLKSELASLGLLSFVLLAQVAPSVVAALYWRNASSTGVMWGLMIGCGMWFYTLFLPTISPEASLVTNGLLGISALIPTQLFGVEGLDLMSHGLLFSLGANVLCVVVVSFNSQRSINEKLQAYQYVANPKSRSEHASESQLTLSYGNLCDLVKRFVGEQSALEMTSAVPMSASPDDIATNDFVNRVQMVLSSVLGSASTKLVMEAAANDSIQNQPDALAQVVNIVDEASQLFAFNRELLQAGVENIEQGISVVDADMRLVAWNTRYVELLEFPSDFLKAGMPIADIIKFNVERDIIIGEDQEALVAKRIRYMAQGTKHNYQRVLPSGIVLEIRGQAMPGGGFVSTFTDITDHIEAEKALQEANELLEQRVSERTKELAVAKAEAEAANVSKTKFLAAASHDLMQPFNALSLFTSMLQQKAQNTDIADLAQNIEGSLHVVEDLLKDLLEISKLDSGVQKIELSTFCIDDIAAPLVNEFGALAKVANISLRYRPSSLMVHSDRRLVRRILQNFLANAVRYAPMALEHSPVRQLKIVFGVKRKQNQATIYVVDNGPGIPDSKAADIFNEFERLEQPKEAPGLGLGLAICQRISQLLDAPISVSSKLNKGASFGLTLPTVQQKHQSAIVTSQSPSTIATSFNDLNVAVLDNEPLIVEALSQQLSMWGFTVFSATHGQELLDVFESKQTDFDLVIADYHLDKGELGTDFVAALNNLGWIGPTIICSADPNESIRLTCHEMGFNYMRKPIKALALKRLLKRELLEGHARHRTVVHS